MSGGNRSGKRRPLWNGRIKVRAIKHISTGLNSLTTSQFWCFFSGSFDKRGRKFVEKVRLEYPSELPRRLLHNYGI